MIPSYHAHSDHFTGSVVVSRLRFWIGLLNLCFSKKSQKIDLAFETKVLNILIEAIFIEFTKGIPVKDFRSKVDESEAYLLQIIFKNYFFNLGR